MIIRVTAELRPLASVGALAGSPSAASSIAFGFVTFVSNTLHAGAARRIAVAAAAVRAANEARRKMR